MPGGGTSGCADPHLRQGGTYFQCNGPVRQSLYRRRSMGGSQGPELRQTMLRFLGWRPSVPRAHYFIRTGQVDVGERIASIRFWHIQQDRKFCQRRVDRGGEAEQPRSEEHTSELQSL